MDDEKDKKVVMQEEEPDYEVLITAIEIEKRVKELGKEIRDDYDPEDNVVLIGILTGALMFQSDLARQIGLKNLTLETMEVSSYIGTESNRDPIITKYPKNSIEGKDVIIVEDIIDTGYSMRLLIQKLTEMGANSIKICTLLSKDDRREVDVPIHFCGFKIPDVWVEGYGLDTNEKGRCWLDILIRKPKVKDL